MKLKIALLFVLFTIVSLYNGFGAYIHNFPITLTQPSGAVFNCFLSGDEYYNWIHTKDNYTIVQDLKTGYYCYAITENSNLIASEFIVGESNPTSIGIKPGLNLSSEQIYKIRDNILLFQNEGLSKEKSNVLSLKNQDLNNIVIYIRFSDQSEFSAKQATYSSFFNSNITGANSMLNYFKETSYEKLNVLSNFYPINNGTQILSYQDCHTRNYYRPWSSQNDSGYSINDNGTMSRARESELLTNALNFVKNQISPNLNLDYNNDGKVDNICFIIRGYPDTNSILWPKKYRLGDNSVYINSKKTYNYNFQIESLLDSNGVSVLCHEMFHTFGGKDLYYNNFSSMVPVGEWDLMSNNTNPPQSMCTLSKYLYSGWIDSIPEITQSGHYSLNAISSPTNNCYKIYFSNTEFFMLEFRNKIGTFEGSIPGTGLLIYRVNKSIAQVNTLGPPFFLYYYRPNGTLEVNGDLANASFGSSQSRSTFHNETNPSCFLSDGSLGNVYIKNIQILGNMVAFDVRFCDDTNVQYSNTNALPLFTNAAVKIETIGSVLVKNTDIITFEAGQEIILNSGFEVQTGGVFEINMNGCGNR